MSVSNIPLLSSSADTGDDTRDMVANSKKVDFGWIGFWLLLSSQWHEQQENTRKSKQKLIFLLINLCVMIFIVVADILLIIVKVKGSIHPVHPNSSMLILHTFPKMLIRITCDHFFYSCDFV